MPSFLDDPDHFELEDPHPDYWQPRERNRRPWQEIEAANAEFRRRSAEIMTRLHQEWAKEDEERAKREAEP